MVKEKQIPYKASGLNFSAAPSNRANLPNTTRTENLPSNVRDKGNPSPPIMDVTTRGRQMTGGRPQMQKPVPRREKKVASTLLFAHETIGTKETIATKQYPQST